MTLLLNRFLRRGTGLLRQRQRSVSSSAERLTAKGFLPPRNVEDRGYANLPRNIVIVRHGRSLGNEDSEAYTCTPDWKIPLTPQGELEAQEASEVEKRWAALLLWGPLLVRKARGARCCTDHR